MRLRVTRKSVSRIESGMLVTYRAGDEIMGTERLMRSFGDRVVSVSEATVSDSGLTGAVGHTLDVTNSVLGPEPDADVQAVLDAPAPEAKELAKSLTEPQLEVAVQLETRKGVGGTLNTLLGGLNA